MDAIDRKSGAESGAGSDEPSPPGKKGTYLSYFFIISCIIASIIFQNYVTDNIGRDSWSDGCKKGYEDDCASNSAVYRFSFALVILFGIQLVGMQISRRFFDDYWLYKTALFVGVLIGFFYAPARMFDDRGYAWFARIAAAIFVVLQQIILIDLAYSWNELWVEYSGGREENNKWLIGLIVVSLFLYAAAFTVIGLLYWQFSGCPENDAIISLTLILVIAVTIFQLYVSDEGNLLTSSIIAAYATYLCYAAVSLNPDSECNPLIATSYQTLTEVIGICITIVSLSWTVFSAGRLGFCSSFYIIFQFTKCHNLSMAMNP